jgi:hypothetical protein
LRPWEPDGPRGALTLAGLLGGCSTDGPRDPSLTAVAGFVAVVTLLAEPPPSGQRVMYALRAGGASAAQARGDSPAGSGNGAAARQQGESLTVVGRPG